MRMRSCIWTTSVHYRSPWPCWRHPAPCAWPARWDQQNSRRYMSHFVALFVRVEHGEATVRWKRAEPIMFIIFHGTPPHQRHIFTVHLIPYTVYMLDWVTSSWHCVPNAKWKHYAIFKHHHWHKVACHAWLHALLRQLSHQNCVFLQPHLKGLLKVLHRLLNLQWWAGLSSVYLISHWSCTWDFRLIKASMLHYAPENNTHAMS